MGGYVWETSHCEGENKLGDVTELRIGGYLEIEIFDFSELWASEL